MIYDVVVIGAGFSGTATTIQLLNQLKKSTFRIAIIERRYEFIGTGLAYNDTIIDPVHMLNVQPERMSIFPDRPNDFLSWLKENRESLPDEYRKNMDQSSVPRPVFGLYLKSRLDEALLSTQCVVTILQDSAVDIKVRFLRGTKIFLMSGVSIYATHVVVATGNLLVKKVDSMCALQNDDRFLNDRWAQGSKDWINAMNRKSRLLILGTGAAMFDTLCNLHDMGFAGNIVALSRNGYINEFYPKKYTPKPAKVALPKLSETDYQNEALLVYKIKQAYQNALKQVTKTGTLVPSEEILMTWEKGIPKFLRHLTREQIRFFFSNYQSLLSTKRLGLVPKTWKSFVYFSRKRKIQVVAADVLQFKTDPSGVHVFYNKKITKRLKNRHLTM